MYVKYVCDPGCLKSMSAEGVSRIDPDSQIELLCEFFGVNMPPEDRERFSELSRTGQQEDFGVILDGRMVARACIIHDAPNPFEIMCVFVKPEYRGRGYAKRVVGRCAEVLLARGLEPMGITKQENAPMRAVFRTLGFREAPCDIQD